MIGALLTSAAAAMGLAKLVSKQMEVDAAAAPYMGQIQKMAVRHNIPENILIGIMWQESRFKPDATGSAGEIGIAQFKKIAADDVEMNIEDFNDPNVAIDGAARLLALNRKRSGGNLWDSIRAYNAGIGAAKKDAGAASGYAMDVMITAVGRTFTKMMGLV